MIRVTAYEYMLQERERQTMRKKKAKEDNGFQQLLEAEIQKLKGAEDGKGKNQRQYQNR